MKKYKFVKSGETFHIQDTESGNQTLCNLETITNSKTTVSNNSFKIEENVLLPLIPADFEGIADVLMDLSKFPYSDKQFSTDDASTMFLLTTILKYSAFYYEVKVCSKCIALICDTMDN